MNVACGACPAKYVIPDEKVRGRKVRIPCKRCGAAIIIDGTSATLTNAGASPDEQAASAAPAKPLTVPRGKEETNPSPPVPVVAEPTTKVTVPKPAPQQAVRPQRTIRQTIIGVAAPANAPESAPARQAPIRRPTPIYVRAPNVTTQVTPSPSDQPPVATGRLRSLRRTMVGGLDGEEPGAAGPATGLPSASSPEMTRVGGTLAKPRSREIKHTIIGGLEAPPGSAPGAEEPRKRPIPRQDTPLGTWMAILPDGKTLRITEKDLSRALSKSFVNGETLFWRTGMQGWVPLSQIPELNDYLNKASDEPQPRIPAAHGASKSVSRAPNPAPRAQPSQPAPVPSFSRPPAAARVPTPSATAQKRAGDSTQAAMSAASPQVASSPFTTSAAKMSRGPASVSARSSSPTLELVELNDDADIAGLVRAQEASSNSGGIEELHRLAASANTAQKASFNPTSRTPAAPTPTFSSEAIATNCASGSTIDSNRQGIDPVRGPYQHNAQPASDAQQPIEIPPSIPRQKSSKITTTLLVVLLFLACLAASIIVRQPRPLYDYLYKRGWGKALDTISGPPLKKIEKLFTR